MTAPAKRARLTLTPLQRSVLAYLKGHPGQSSYWLLGQATGASEADVGEAAGVLAAQGLVVLETDEQGQWAEFVPPRRKPRTPPRPLPDDCYEVPDLEPVPVGDYRKPADKPAGPPQIPLPLEEGR